MLYQNIFSRNRFHGCSDSLKPRTTPLYIAKCFIVLEMLFVVLIYIQYYTKACEYVQSSSLVVKHGCLREFMMANRIIITMMMIPRKYSSEGKNNNCTAGTHKI